MSIFKYKNIIKKFITAFLFVFIFSLPFAVNAQYDFAFHGISGKGTWEKSNGVLTFKGETTAPDGNYSGTWGIDSIFSFRGDWSGSSINEKISGTFTSKSFLNEDSGFWHGDDPTNSGKGVYNSRPDINDKEEILLKNKNQSRSKETVTTYNLLQPFGDKLQTFDAGVECALTNYVNIVFDIFIGICAVLAFVMLVIGGIQYMGSELISSKEAAKSQATNALLDLLIAFSAWLILNTINPKLLDFCLDKNLQTAYSDSLGGEGNGAFIPIDEEKLQALGITKCTGSGGKAVVPEIAKQFIGKTSYSQAKRNTIQGNTIYLDCSSFVAQVYTCAGLPHPGSNTAEMFSGSAQPVDGKTYDFSKLNPGDLIGWKSGNGEKDGHVMIYLGGDQMIDTNSSINTAFGSISKYKHRIKYVKWPN